MVSQQSYHLGPGRHITENLKALRPTVQGIPQHIEGVLFL